MQFHTRLVWPWGHECMHCDRHAITYIERSVADLLLGTLWGSVYDALNLIQHIVYTALEAYS